MAKPGTRIHWKRTRTKAREWDKPNTLTDAEGTNVLNALWLLRTRYKPWRRIAELLGVNYRYLRRVIEMHKPPMAGLAIRAARLLEIPTDAVLAGKFQKPNKCRPNSYRRKDGWGAPRSI